MTVTRNYAIGPLTAPQTGYTQGVFKDFKTAIRQTGKYGEYLWRLDDSGKGKPDETRIRQWSVGKSDWIKLHDPDEAESSDPRLAMDVVYVVGYPNDPNYKGMTSYLKLPSKVGEPVTRRADKDDATEFTTQSEAERNAEIWSKPPKAHLPPLVMSRARGKVRIVKDDSEETELLSKPSAKESKLTFKTEPQTEYTNDLDLAYFENGLKFSKNALDDALLEQPSLLQQASDRYAIALSRRDQAKDEIKQLEGQLYVQIRHELEGKGDKPTEALLAARINSHPARIEAVQKHSRAVEECGRWEGIKDGYKDRGYAIKVMADLYAAGYWSNNSAQGADYRQKNADYDENQEIRRNAYRNRQGNVR